ncbi:MAG: hypothetical protein JOZ85_07325 [Betaproteobacteria bacterium]|nr:hypothetical protein [Betaproteobacteria bacterium]
MNRETHHRTLMRACLIAGDEVTLASRLHVPLPSLVDWLLGEVPVPVEVFLRAVDIVIAANKETMADSKALLEQIRKRHRPD